MKGNKSQLGFGGQWEPGILPSHVLFDVPDDDAKTAGHQQGRLKNLGGVIPVFGGIVARLADDGLENDGLGDQAQRMQPIQDGFQLRNNRIRVFALLSEVQIEMLELDEALMKHGCFATELVAGPLPGGSK